MAVTACVPEARPEYASVAMPLALRVEDPMDKPSAKKFTVPVGVPPLPETLAVKVAAVSTTEGLG